MLQYLTRKEMCMINSSTDINLVKLRVKRYNKRDLFNENISDYI